MSNRGILGLALSMRTPGPSEDNLCRSPLKWILSIILSACRADASESVEVRLVGSTKYRLNISENRWPEHFLLNLELDSNLPNDDFVEPEKYAKALVPEILFWYHDKN